MAAASVDQKDSGAMNCDRCAIHQKEARKLKRALTELTRQVAAGLNALDTLMRQCESHERGSKIALICNALEMANDSARYFALGVDYRTDRKVKRAKVAAVQPWGSGASNTK
jgi:hypothetical protein